MDEFKAYRLTGHIYEWPVGEVTLKHLTECRRLKHIGSIPNSRWDRFDYQSPVPLVREIELSELYTYPVFCRRSGPRIAIMSVSRRVVEDLSQTLAKEVLVLQMQTITISVDALVKAIVERPTDYCLSYVYAKVPAFGASLRSISCFGEDLGEAAIFRSILGLMSIYQCGLKSSTAGQEIVRLGNDGRINFQLSDLKRPLEVEKVLRYLREHGYLTTALFEG